MTKRLFDVAIAGLGLIVTAPILAIAAILIKREDGGSVLYGSVRVGKDGREFRMWKLRTMVPNANRIGGPNTADDDPRLTRLGKKLRRYKLDELPQLLNVFSGEMSLVGPRPEVPEYVALYSPEEWDLLRVRPGITDWASIRFSNEGEILRGSADPEKAYFEKIRPEKVRLGLEYVRCHNLWTDLQILGQTVATLLQRKEARDRTAA